MYHNHIIQALHDNGHEAYFVGGCVRDTVMGKDPKDWDIATSATPEQVMSIFPDNVPIGAKFGVVLVDGHEVTTFRTEADHVGHDCSVQWTDLRTDASRRDFTMNAMYMDMQGRVIDLFDGRYHIKEGILRTVGEAKRRFAEDPLRMLRAVRFSRQYDLAPSEDILAALDGKLLSSLSMERVRDELLKILRVGSGLRLLSTSGLLQYILPEIERLKTVEQDSRHPEGNVFEHTNLVLCAAIWNKDRVCLTDTLTMAALLHDVGKFDTQEKKDGDKISFIGHEDSALPEEIMRRLKFSNDQIDTVVWLVKNHMRMHRFFDMKKSKRHSLMCHKDWVELQALHLYDCLGSGKGSVSSEGIRVYADAVSTHAPKTLSKRLVNGHDLMALGYKPGKEMGVLLEELEEAQREGAFSTKEEGIAWFLDKQYDYYLGEKACP